MESPAKGTVTPIASLFSAEETRKAVNYVEEKIQEKQIEMNRLQHFVDENNNLISLVKKLPDQLHHNVMVPFGKMAFFPGRLIHTNECLVLLGENYYTDRTSKQTIDVLKRRDKTLKSQIHSLKAEIQDFQTEASFFTTTASEAAEGLVEIREEYVEEEEDSSVTVLPLSVKETAEDEIEDDEFARIMSRLNELEIEEEQEECDDEDDVGEVNDSPVKSVEESEHKIVSEAHDSSIDVLRAEKHPLKDLLTRIKPEAQWLPKEDQTLRDFQATSSFAIAKANTNLVGPQKSESTTQKPEPEFDTNKAFTGSIIERSDNLEINKHSQMQSQPSKPVSRFMAQRR